MMKRDDEQERIVKLFQKNEIAFCGKGVLIYGVGKNTQAILEGSHGFRIVGLMDEKLSGHEKYGLKVLSEEEAIAGYNDDRIIVIVARDSVVSIIYKRIEHLHKECGIRIYDYKGTDLTEIGSTFISKDIPYWNASKEELFRAIDEHDIISFDIFDTLLMRCVLEPKDVFRVVEMRLKKMGIDIPFYEIRIESEESLAHMYPSLDDIYSKMRLKLPSYTERLSDIREIEEKTDREQFVVREVLRDALDHAVKKGKRVYVLSDMYYSSEYLDELLRENGISGYDKVFVSNEMKATKEEGEAYRQYKNEVCFGEECRILHIGDNRYADGRMAEKYGIDTFLVYSGYELLMASSMQNLLVDMKDFGRRCILGLLIARLFRDPFVLGKTRGEVCIDDIENLGYGFVAPMLTEYARWLERVVSEREVHQIVFTARDGYLIKNLFELAVEKNVKAAIDLDKQRTEDVTDAGVKCIYIRTSRRSATVAGIRNEEDIIRISARRFNGTIGELMKRRFGVDIAGDERGSMHVSQDEGLILEEVIHDYHSAILSESEKERSEYHEYLRNQGIDFDSFKYSLVFDFVSSGTVWYYLSRCRQCHKGN